MRALTARQAACLICSVWVMVCAWDPVHSTGGSDPVRAWQVVHGQSAASAGGPTMPSIRYGHAVGVDGDAMLVTLGYYFDREANHATWKSDTWALDMCAPHAWARLHAGIEQEHALKSYQAGSAPHSPAGRFGHSAVTHGGLLYVYGGHDGGYSRHGEQNYVPGYDFDELWAFSPATRTWALLPPSGGEVGAPSPGPRYLHAAALVAAGRMVVTGGLQKAQGDMWSLDLHTRSWSLLAPEAARSNGGPGRRVGASLSAVEVPGGASGVLLLGGRYIDPDGSSSLDAAPFFFDLSKNTWRAVDSVGAAGGPVPVGRKYHAQASTWLRVATDGSFLGADAPADATSAAKEEYVLAIVMLGGTITTPGLTCSEEAWLATVDCGAQQVVWTVLPGLAPATYDLRGVLSASGVVFSFGGHLCPNSKGDMPFYYTNAVSKLDLPASGVRVPASACRVRGEKLPAGVRRGGGVVPEVEL
ncbi:hypothetical protein FOA52_015919 [Chlamydomonas sp. UWO 241]|nr:hypothetical protein FOA52_015919 [Chlamydomonas sp. UWO 241]